VPSCGQDLPPACVHRLAAWRFATDAGHPARPEPRRQREPRCASHGGRSHRAGLAFSGCGVRSLSARQCRRLWCPSLDAQGPPGPGVIVFVRRSILGSHVRHQPCDRSGPLCLDHGVGDIRRDGCCAALPHGISRLLGKLIWQAHPNFDGHTVRLPRYYRSRLTCPGEGRCAVPRTARSLVRRPGGGAGPRPARGRLPRTRTAPRSRPRVTAGRTRLPGCTRRRPADTAGCSAGWRIRRRE
jgi:hypothetical protein